MRRCSVYRRNRFPNGKPGQPHAGYTAAAILADVFGVRIDALFGKNAQAVVCVSADDVLDAACGSLRRILTEAVGKRDDEDKSSEKALAEYERALSEDHRMRSAVLRGHGVVYYREALGGLLLKRPRMVAVAASGRAGSQKSSHFWQTRIFGRHCLRF